MRQFEVGDIVKFKGSEIADYYMITEESTFEDSEGYVETTFIIAQVYPVEKISIESLVEDDEVEIVAYNGSKDHELMLKFIMQERRNNSWFEEPHFMRTLNKKNGEETVIKALTKTNDNDLINADEFSAKIVVRYDQIETIDKCLDAINDLKSLHDFHGDAAYLQLIEVVEKRIIELM